jgi:antitoxin component YwqK of YwqJK toxin-antitoxin module
LVTCRGKAYNFRNFKYFKTIIVSIGLILFNSSLFSQPKHIIKVDTIHWKDGGYTFDTYLNDTLIHRRSYFKDSTQEQVIGNYYGSAGYYKQFYSNGNVKFERFEYNNEDFGIWIYWNELGQRSFVEDINDEDTTVIATYYEYFETGVLKSVKRYKGKLYKLVKDKDGNTQRLYSKKEELTKTGTWIYFSEFGELI